MKKREILHILLASHSRELASKLETLLKEALPGQINFHWARSEKESIQYTLQHQLDILFMSDPANNAQTSKTIELLTHRATIPVIALCSYTKQNFRPFELLKIGFSDLLLKEDLTPQLLRHNILTNLARNELLSSHEKPEKTKGQDVNQELIDICKNIPMGIWKFDYTNNELTFSDKMQAALNLHQSIYNLSLTDFMRLVHPEDRKKMEAFFSHAQREKTFSTSFRLSAHHKKDQHKNILLLAAPSQKNAEKNLTQGLQIILPENENRKPGNDRYQEIGEWFLDNALETLKEVSGSASLPIFKQITRIQQEAARMQKLAERTKKPEEEYTPIENSLKKINTESIILKGLKDISTLVDIYVKTSNDLMAHYILTRGIPNLNELPFLIDDITSLLEAYFKKKARVASIQAVIENLGGGKQVIMGNPGFSGFLFYNLIKAVLKIARPHSSATFRHEHKKSESGRRVNCTLEIIAQTEKIHSSDLKLLNSIKEPHEIGGLIASEKSKILTLSSMAICAFGLRSQENDIQFEQNKGGTLRISCKLYAKPQSSRAKDNMAIDNILVLDPYAPHQLLIQGKLINFFPQANIDVFDNEEKMLATVKEKIYQVIFISSSYLSSGLIKKWQENERTLQTPLVFLYETHSKKEEAMVQKYKQAYYIPKTFSFDDLKTIKTTQTIDLLH